MIHPDGYGSSSWSNYSKLVPLYVIAENFNQAGIKGIEYYKLKKEDEILKQNSILDSDGSLKTNSKEEEFIIKVKSVKVISEEIII